MTSWNDARALLFRTDGFYRPVVAATFALDRAVYGLAPFGFGVTNLCLLLLGACALAYLAASLGLRPTMAIVVCWCVGAQFSFGEHGRVVAERAHRPLRRGRRGARRGRRRARKADRRRCRCVRRDAREGRGGDAPVHSQWMGVGAAGDGSAATRAPVVRQTWPVWIALAIYFALRVQTAAMTPMTAPDAYRFVLSPGALVGNALEYLDRACTFSAIVVIVAHLIAWRRPALTPEVRRVLLPAALWFAGTFALTVFVPNRSSLYALLPSIAPALLTGFLLQQLWDTASPMAHRRLVAAAAHSSVAAPAGVLVTQCAMDRDRPAVVRDVRRHPACRAGAPRCGPDRVSRRPELAALARQRLRSAAAGGGPPGCQPRHQHRARKRADRARAVPPESRSRMAGSGWIRPSSLTNNSDTLQGGRSCPQIRSIQDQFSLRHYSRDTQFSRPVDALRVWRRRARGDGGATCARSRRARGGLHCGCD